MNDTIMSAQTPAKRPARLRFALLAACALVGGGIGGTGGFALAAGGGSWHGGWHGGPRLERVQHMVTRALDAVGATSAQESRIHDIVASGFAEQMKDGDGREAMRKQMLDLLRAPTVDRAAVEKLRADQVAAFDARSKAFVASVMEAADQLTPDQRTRLADRVTAMMERHHGMDGEPRWHGRDGRGPGGDGDHDRPGDGPDKG